MVGRGGAGERGERLSFLISARISFAFVIICVILELLF